MKKTNNDKIISDKSVSKYFEKQWEKFNKIIEEESISNAFVIKEPEIEQEEETMYSRIKNRRYHKK